MPTAVWIYVMYKLLLSRTQHWFCSDVMKSRHRIPIVVLLKLVATLFPDVSYDNGLLLSSVLIRLESALYRPRCNERAGQSLRLSLLPCVGFRGLLSPWLMRVTHQYFTHLNSTGTFLLIAFWDIPFESDNLNNIICTFEVIATCSHVPS